MRATGQSPALRARVAGTGGLIYAASMKGVWLEDQALDYRDDLPDPEPQAGEALIRVHLAGICGTDLQLLNGYYPFAGIPGHEFVGEVVAAPDDETWQGRRVAGEINVSCGVCLQCRAGRTTHCENRSVLGIRNRHGTFAQYLTLPLSNLHVVPDGVPDEAAVFTEPVAAALQILEQVPLRPTDSVLVIGAGRLGQLVAQVLNTGGTNLTVVARYPRQRALLETLGIAVLGEDQLPLRSQDVVVDATGSRTGLVTARGAVRPRGTIVLKSTYKGETAVDWSEFVVDELTVIGSRCGPFGPALRLLEHKKIDPTVLIEERCYVTEASRAFEAAARKGALKVLFDFR